MYLHNCNGKDNRKDKTLKDAVMKWQKQAGNITTNPKVKVNFILPALSATDVVT